MDLLRTGRAYRAPRIRKGWRQADLSGLAGVSRQLIAKIESGRIEDVQVGSLRRIGNALGASIDIVVRWRGEGLDRLLDAAHAGLVDTVVERLRRAGWQTIVEASFSIRGERGSIDVLAFHAPSGTLLIVEVKSVVPDSQAMLHAVDRYVRLGPEIARERGWTCSAVGRLLVIGESTTARRRVQLLASTYESAFPHRGARVSVWLRRPVGPMSGLIFVPFATQGGTTNRVTGRQRVRKPST